MSYLSDEQMACIGMPRDANPSWSLVDLPVGPRELAPWAKGLAVDWGDHHDGDPGFALKTDRDLRHWPDMRYRREGDLWICESGDGRAEPFYQGGELRIERLRRWRSPDGSLSVYAHMLDNGCRLAPGEWVEVDRLCTRQEQGFGGAHIDIVMQDGTPVTLRGPWHGPCPAGYVEVRAVNMNSPYCRARYARKKPWAQRSSGLATISVDVFVPAFARYLAHLRLVAVNMGHGDRLQPMKPEWDEPKAWVRGRARLARKLAAFEAMDPAVRPPHAACNFVLACGGKADCAVADCNRCTPKAKP